MTAENVGVFGVLCGQKTKEKVLGEMSARGRQKHATCNRWAQHDGLHRQTDGKTFEVCFEWPDSECALPDWKDEKRRQMAVAQRESK